MILRAKSGAVKLKTYLMYWWKGRGEGMLDGLDDVYVLKGPKDL